MHICICRDVSSLIHLKTCSFIDLRVWKCSDKSEYTEHSVIFISYDLSEFTCFNILNSHLRKDSVTADFFYNCIPHKVKFFVLECFLLNGFCCTKFITSVNNCNFSCEFCKVHSFFYCRVSSTYYVYFKIFEEVCITGSTVRNALTHEFFFAFASDRSCKSSGCDDNRFCLIFGFRTLQYFDIAFQMCFINYV